MNGSSIAASIARRQILLYIKCAISKCRRLSRHCLAISTDSFQADRSSSIEPVPQAQYPFTAAGIVFAGLWSITRVVAQALPARNQWSLMEARCLGKQTRFCHSFHRQHERRSYQVLVLNKTASVLSLLTTSASRIHHGGWRLQ